MELEGPGSYASLNDSNKRYKKNKKMDGSSYIQQRTKICKANYHSLTIKNLLFNHIPVIKIYFLNQINYSYKIGLEVYIFQSEYYSHQDSLYILQIRTIVDSEKWQLCEYLKIWIIFFLNIHLNSIKVIFLVESFFGINQKKKFQKRTQFLNKQFILFHQIIVPFKY